MTSNDIIESLRARVKAWGNGLCDHYYDTDAELDIEAADHIETITTSGKLVYCVLCLNSNDPGDQVHHIFSSMEKAEAWAATDDRPHIISDYVIDVPERKELRNT